jgi:hypothetical protein
MNGQKLKDLYSKRNTGTFPQGVAMRLVSPREDALNFNSIAKLERCHSHQAAFLQSLMHTTCPSFVGLDFKSKLFNKSLRDFIMEEKTCSGVQLFHSVDPSWQGGHLLHYHLEDECAASMLANGGLLPRLYYRCSRGRSADQVERLKLEVNKWFTPDAVVCTAQSIWDPKRRCVVTAADAALDDMEEDPLVKRFSFKIDEEAQQQLHVVDPDTAIPEDATASTYETMRNKKATKTRQAKPRQQRNKHLQRLVTRR